MAQGQIPGKSYAIGEWTAKSLFKWAQENMPSLLPASIQTQDAQLGTVTVNTSLSLSPAALADLKTQLGLS